jgi:hypothetical protein
VIPEPFIDYYDVLQLSPSADEDTVHRIFRHLAQKCHPDVTDSGDSAKFRLLVEAHGILTNVETRAAFDAKYQDYWNRKWKLASEASQGTAFAEDAETRHKILSLLYVQRRRDMRAPGLGEYELSRLLRTPIELVDFHLWYLREKGLVARVDTGQIAISALGVEEIERTQLRLDSDRLLAARGERSTDHEPESPAEGSRTLEEGNKQE